MKKLNCFSTTMLVMISLAFLTLLFPGYANAQVNTAPQFDTRLGPWLGLWSIVDDRATAEAPDKSSMAKVEIRPTADHQGLAITRRMPKQPDVSEVLVLDGTKKQVDSNDCTGWQAAKLIPEFGIITTSSETTCKESGSFSTSNMKLILSGDQMVDILAIKANGQTRLAVRRMLFEKDLIPSADSKLSLTATAARTSVSAPWNLDTIIQLSGSVDSSALEAALLEKHTYLTLRSKSLKQMKAANVPKSIIDLLVALSLPDKFQIVKNGQVALKPLAVSSPQASSPSLIYPGGFGYYPGSFFNCFSRYGYFYGIDLWDSTLPGNCYSYYSPFWWDYPMYFPGNPGSSGGGGGGVSVGRGYVSANNGYVQIEPRDTGHHAKYRDGYTPIFGAPGASSGRGTAAYSGGGYSGGSSGGYSGSSSGGYSGASSGGGGSSGGGSASPGGYSSGGGGGGGGAVPR